MTAPAITHADPDAGLRGMPDALRVALIDDAENLAVALTEAVLADGLGFKGPFEEFGRIAEPLLLDALGAARRDGAQIANDAASETIATLLARATAAEDRLREREAEIGRLLSAPAVEAACDAFFSDPIAPWSLAVEKTPELADEVRFRMRASLAAALALTDPTPASSDEATR